jgi:hypothetical protein
MGIGVGLVGLAGDDGTIAAIFTIRFDVVLVYVYAGFHWYSLMFGGGF